MSIPVLGMLISGFALASFFLLFSFEQKRGARFFSSGRDAIDIFVIRLRMSASRFSYFLGRKVIRQTIHYLFHRALTSLLYFLERAEENVKRVLRTNKSIARRLENSPDRPKNKLDEIAEHKQSVALTESEKKKHKQKSLEG